MDNSCFSNHFDQIAFASRVHEGSKSNGMFHRSFECLEANIIENNIKENENKPNDLFRYRAFLGSKGL